MITTVKNNELPGTIPLGGTAYLLNPQRETVILLALKQLGVLAA